MVEKIEETQIYTEKMKWMDKAVKYGVKAAKETDPVKKTEYEAKKKDCLEKAHNALL